MGRALSDRRYRPVSLCPRPVCRCASGAAVGGPLSAWGNAKRPLERSSLALQHAARYGSRAQFSPVTPAPCVAFGPHSLPQRRCHEEVRVSLHWLTTTTLEG